MASYDVIDTHGQSLSIIQSNVCVRVMARHPELCFVVLALLVIVLGRYGTSLQTKTITVPPRPPKRFFPSQSPVIDLPYGNLEPVVSILEKEQFIFVMYYAPWCAKSMSLRWEFQKAARYMHNQVKFIGINCWWPEGSCRKRYKFMMFPVLYAYFSDLDGYRYLGSSSAEFMVKFLEDLIYPLLLLHTESQVKEMVAKYDMAMIAYFGFNASPQPPGYLQYYYASMRSVEHDPYQIMKYGIITQDSLATMYNLKYMSDIVLLRSANSTLNYPVEANYTSSSIVYWLLQNRQKPIVKMITPLGVKSLTLSRQVSLGPSLILFTPIDQLFNVNLYYSMLKSIGLSFRTNCSTNSVYSSEDVSHSWKTYNVKMYKNYQSVIQMCELLKTRNLPQNDKNKCCVTLANRSESKNICEFCQHKLTSLGPVSLTPASCKINPQTFASSQFSSDKNVNICLSSGQNYNLNEHSSFTCKSCSSESTDKSHEFVKSSERRRRTDRYVYHNLEILPLRLCKRLTLQKIQSLPPVPEYQEVEVPDHFYGLGCKQNKSLQFYAIDSMHHSLFAERLGIDLHKLSRHPAAVIIDKQAEEHYILRENITASSVVTFIVNYTNGLLRRNLVSSKPQIKTCSNSDACATELTSQTFLQSITRVNQDVVVLVYSEWCGYCISVNHVYLSLLKYFRLNKNIVFTRIDGDSNNLPWEYTVEKYPSILFFPANRKADSVVFPDTVDITLTNLIRFVFQHSTYKLRTQTAVSVCTQKCILKNQEYAQRMEYLLKQRLNHLQTRFTLITRVTNNYVNYAVPVLSQKIMKIVQQLEKIKKLKVYLLNSPRQIEYSKIAAFIFS